MSTCVRIAGGLTCWGENNHYQKLDGTTANALSPVAIDEFTSGVTSFETGFDFSCVVVGGGVKCWGTNSLGQLGDGTTISRTAPVDVVGLTSGVTKVIAGWKHACALLSDGGVKCWGDNSSGELGRGFNDGAGGYRNTADFVTGMNSGVTDIFTGSARSEHTCAIVNGGALCWGYNAWGQLGDGTASSKSVPTPVNGIGASGSGVIQIAPSRYSSCALLTGGFVKCWGDNDYGQLGNNNLGVNSLLPVDTNLANLAVGEAVADIGTGEDQACLRTDLGAVYCWGRDHAGQLGDGAIGGSVARPQASLITSGATQLSVGRYHSCVYTSDDKVKCWGLGNFGQLGQGNTSNSATPLEVSY